MEDMKNIPVYRQTGMYAREHDELDQFRQSNVANIACRAAIEEAISKNFDGMHLKNEPEKEVLDVFGKERVEHVLANTIQQKEWDGRFSRSNKEWASAFDIPADVVMGRDRRLQFIVNSHPAVLDGFISQTRKVIHEKERPSVRGQLQKKDAHVARKQPAMKKEAVR